MKYVFGVMSLKWSLEAPDLRTAKCAMSVFIGKNVPIAIYEPIQEAFMPKEVFEVELMNKEIILFKEAVASIEVIE